ncbi:MAG: aspartate aminotransferase family protein, partial [Moorea sp. SIO3I7]|nr:aspartate aminotransferase family protein [Moorena sp. SIO3I7]
LELLKKPGTYEQLDSITKKLSEGLLEIAKDAGHAATGGYISAMFGMFFTGVPVHNFDDAKTCDLSKFTSFHRGMLERGIYLAPSQFEAGFTSLAHTEDDIDRTLAAAKEVISGIKP